MTLMIDSARQNGAHDHEHGNSNEPSRRQNQTGGGGDVAKSDCNSADSETVLA
jgi:hypothetical protein